MRVLITDDDRAMAECLRAVLESVGHVAEVTTSGTEALDRAQHQSPDCVLLDLKMPGISGLETLSELRLLGTTCPVIFMTGYSPVRLAEGRNGVIAKLDQRPETETVAQFLADRSPRESLLIGHADATFCRALQPALERRELPTLMTTNVEQALMAFEAEPGRMIILNLLSDALSGFVARELNPGLVVHLLTLTDQSHEDHRLSCLQKPFAMEKLIDAVERTAQLKGPD